MNVTASVHSSFLAIILFTNSCVTKTFLALLTLILEHCNKFFSMARSKYFSTTDKSYSNHNAEISLLISRPILYLRNLFPNSF